MVRQPQRGQRLPRRTERLEPQVGGRYDGRPEVVKRERAPSPVALARGLRWRRREVALAYEADVLPRGLGGRRAAWKASSQLRTEGSRCALLTGPRNPLTLIRTSRAPLEAGVHWTLSR